MGHPRFYTAVNVLPDFPDIPAAQTSHHCKSTVMNDTNVADLRIVAHESASRPSKVVITIRLDPDIVFWFKSHGPGYQTRINELLREFVEREALSEAE